MSSISTPNSLNKLDLALIYVSRGWWVFPLAVNGKVPHGGLAPHGWKDATTDPEIVKSWWTQCPDANIGIACGPSNLFVVDVDCGRKDYVKRVGGESLLDLLREHGDYPKTYEVRTASGGLHIYFQMPTPPLKNTASVLGKDIDTRGIGGHVVAAGSVIGGIAYTLVDESEPAILPKWMDNANRAGKKRKNSKITASSARRRVASLAKELEDAEDGEGNDTAARIAFMCGQYVGAGQLSEDTVISTLLDAVAGWSWASEKDYHTMVNTITSQVTVGAESPREWAATPPKKKASTSATMPMDDEIHRGQMRMAERLAGQHGDDLRYATGLGWFTWDGNYWVEDEGNNASRYVIDTLKSSLREAVDLDSKDRDNLIQDVRKSETHAGMLGVLGISKCLDPISVTYKDLDTNPELFCTPGGTINLKTGEVQPNQREDLMTRMANGKLNVHSPIWDKFIARILPDPEVRAFVQRLIGSSMVGEVRDQIMPIFIGEGGNGKSILRDACLHAFGNYATSVDPELIMEQKFARHGTHKLELMGRRLAFCTETDENRRFSMSTMKQLTGGDPIVGNRMRMDPISFLPSHQLILLTNNLPQVTGDSHAIWRRLLVVPFDVVIPEDEIDTQLSSKLRAEADAVITWAYEGWQDYQKQGGLRPPAAVLTETAAYREESDVVAQYLSAQCTARDELFIGVKSLFEDYQMWCAANGKHADGFRLFSSKVERKGYGKTRTRHGYVFTGLRLISLMAMVQDYQNNTVKYV